MDVDTLIRQIFQERSLDHLIVGTNQMKILTS